MRLNNVIKIGSKGNPATMEQVKQVADTINKKNFRHFVFTTATGLHFYTDKEMYKNKVKTYGFKELKNLIDNNLPFWDNLREIISNSN